MAGTGLPNYSDYLDTPEIKSSRDAYNTAATTASNFVSDAASMPDKLRQAIEGKLNFNRDLISQRAKAMSDYFARPAEARQEYQDIINPIDREALVSRSVANAYMPVQGLSDILSQRMGQESDVINAATGAFNADVTSKQNQTTLARQNLQDLIDMANNKYNAAVDTYKLANPLSGTQAGLQQATIKNIQSDASKGVTLQDLIRKYGGQVDGDTILSLYMQAGYYKNPANTKDKNYNKNIPVGGLLPLIENAQTLMGWGVTPSTAYGVTGQPKPSSTVNKTQATQGMRNEAIAGKNKGVTGSVIYQTLIQEYPELSSSDITATLTNLGININEQ